ncbi:MAG: chemotaxis protein CheW [Beijerinckiaceae bacterium]
MSATSLQERDGEWAPRSVAPLHGTERRYFTVNDGSATFGLPVQSVQTIFRIEGVTPVPLSPAEVDGLVNLRGRIVTAVSLKRRLGTAAAGAARGALAIGIEHRGENFALIVDEVGDVIICDDEARIGRPSHVDPARARLISDYYRFDTGILPILDMNAVFDFERPSEKRGTRSARSHAPINRSES